jgi:cation diffusion facilitator CzcD-associated flavoprotein CzcO
LISGWFFVYLRSKKYFMKTDYKVGIIGAGFGGLTAALRLKNSGRNSFVIFERAAEVGGTWRDNIYPGCGCDVPSPLYSISFEPNPGWSKLFSLQPEIFDYMKNVVKNNQLKPHIRYNTEITEAKFITQYNHWQLTDRTGRQTTVQLLISAIGPLNRPNIPTIKGLENFKGTVFHSSNWNYDCDLTDKRVAVIGTGASAVQFVPQIAPKAKHLTLFQRTPAWIAPRNDRSMSLFAQRLFEKMPIFQKLFRELIYWILELRGLAFVGNETIHRFNKNQAINNLKVVEDEATRMKLTPDYKLGCKRVLLSDEFYPVFNRKNVTLITDNITQIEENKIITDDGQNHEIDVIVLGTGFVAAEIVVDIKIIGIDNRNLFDDWLETGAEAYCGITVSGYPNLAMLVGPNTGLGHNSIIHIIESQMNYVMSYIELLEQRDGAYLDVKKEIQTAHNQVLQKQFGGTVWASGCKSWYLNVEGKNTTLWPKLTVSYRKLTKHVIATDYI